ncbi:MAG: RNA methyltransferase [Bacteroidota bacterium]
MRKLKLEELGRASVEEFRQQEKTPIVLVLDNVRSALNVGSAFRTADAFALERIYLCGITAQPPHREILKTALGATEAVDWVHTPTVEEAIAQLRADNYRIWAVEQAVERTWLQDFNIQQEQPLALVFGNEVNGVSQAVMDQADGAIEIPQYGTKHSFNVSVSLGIVVWEVFRQLKLI